MSSAQFKVAGGVRAGGGGGSLSIAQCNNGQFVGSFLTRINYAWPLIEAVLA